MPKAHVQEFFPFPFFLFVFPLLEAMMDCDGEEKDIFNFTREWSKLFLKKMRYEEEPTLDCKQ